MIGPAKERATDFAIGKLIFGEPMALAIGGGVVALLVLGLALDSVRRRRLIGRVGEQPVLRAMIASVSPARRKLKAVFLVLAAIGIVIALGEPKLKKETEVENRGLDVVFALDVSKSMMVGDVAPSRLEQARKMIKGLLRVTTGDRVAGIAFAGGASHFPLTSDHDVTGAFITDFGPNDVPGGSDLGEAMRVARCLLRPDLYDQLGCPGLIGRRGHGGDPLPGDTTEADRRRRDRFGDRAEPDEPEVDPDWAEPEIEKEERGKVIMVFTDGADEAAKAEEEVVIARQLGITVFVVGFGTEVGGEVWDVDDLGNPTHQKFDEAGKAVISKRDDKGMQSLAAASGDPAHYLIAPPTGEIAVDPLAKALSTVKRGISTQRVKRAKPMFHWFLFPAFMLLVIEALVSTRRRKVTLA